MLYWAFTLCETSAICLHRLQPSSMPTLAGGAPAIRPSRAFVVGWVLVVLGGALRLVCYRTLGQFFTFELAIQRQQRLVTRGPYAVVRHPSYIGCIAIYAGGIMCQFCPGSWFVESGWM